MKNSTDCLGQYLNTNFFEKKTSNKLVINIQMCLFKTNGKNPEMELFLFQFAVLTIDERSQVWFRAAMVNH